MSSSNVKNPLMAMKLKEGIQDTIVFLRMLEGAKLAPVYERKRKQLMEQLVDTQGDTRREAPPKFADSEDDDEEEDTVSPATPVKHRQPSSTSEQENKKRENKLSDRMSKFEKPTTGTGRNFQYRTLEELRKKRNSKADTDLEKLDIEAEITKNVDKDKSTSEEPASPLMDTLEVEKNKTPSTTPTVTPRSTPDTKRKNRAQSLAGGIFNKVKKKKGDSKDRSGSLDVTGKDRSGSLDVTGSNDNLSAIVDTSLTTDSNIAESGKPVVEEEQQPVEEPTPQDDQKESEEDNSDKPFTSHLERVSKRLGRYTYQKIEMMILEESVKFWKHNQNQDKATAISLIGAAAAIRDCYQFEIHTPDKSYTFRAESEELCVKWFTILNEAINVCNPTLIEEEIEEELPTATTSKDVDVPQITVSSSQEGSPEKQPGPSIRNSVSYENFSSPSNQKKSNRKEMPDFSSAQVKGYLYKKGTFGKWEKIWMGLGHDNTLYITTNESNKKITGTILITSETKIEKKRGSDKLPHAMLIITGKNKETFSTNSLQDYTMWLYCLEQASAANDIQELLSEDEDDGELYEELGLDNTSLPQLPEIPRLPQSPRPMSYQQNNPVPDDDDIYEDGFDGGDIYEGLDEVEVPTRVVQPPPISSLPPQRGSDPHPPPISSLPPQRGSDPLVQPPSLPPRNYPVVQPPSLPSRPEPQEYEAPKPSPPSNRKQEFDEEVYDDVIGADQGIFEETYDDIETVNTAIQKLPIESNCDELYEDMVPDNPSLELNEDDEEYSDMTISATIVDEDFYDDVSIASPQHAPPRPPAPVVTKTTISSANVKPPPKVIPLTTVKQTTPTAIKQTTPTAIKQTAPITVKQTTPITVKQGTSVTVKQISLEETKVTPSSPKKSNTLPNRPMSSGATKRLTTTGKVALMSKKFGQSEEQQDTNKKIANKKSNHCGTLMYKSPGKPSYNSNYCVIENNILIFYTTQTDKLSHYRLSLRDAGLKLGIPDGHGAKYTFEILKGTVVHCFSFTSKEDFINWMGALVAATQRVCPDKEDLFHAVKDHHGNGNGEISFKKDDILWIIQRDSPTVWNGIVGSSESTFTNKVGWFPNDNSIIEPLMSEAVYI